MIANRLARSFATLLACLALPLVIQTATAQTTAETTTAPAIEAPPQSFSEWLASSGVKLVKGPATVSLGRVAQFNLADGYAAVEAGSMKRFYELTKNYYNGNEAGVILAPSGWMLFFDYDDVGHVKDDEKDKLNADKLMSTMRENQESANESRAKKGWDQMKVAGWAAKPHYDTRTNNLKWAINLTSSSDNYTTPWVNESIRLLGREGVMNVTLVTETETFAQDSASADGLLAKNFTYVSGQRYSEFREGDKIAKYGLSALVLGGGAAAAYKLGFLSKFWKLIAGGCVAIAAGVRKFWGKITGRYSE